MKCNAIIFSFIIRSKKKTYVFFQASVPLSRTVLIVQSKLKAKPK